MKDNLGDRLKGLEGAESGRKFMPQIPIYARLDGRGFSKFTKGMDRPFDSGMTSAMIETTKYLTNKTHARIGYTQSDEISLVWLADRSDSGVFFDGKIQKMVSVLASMATVAFITELMKTERMYDYAARMPHFDARVFQVPNKIEAANALLWRELDATKNAISMAASHHFSHRDLVGVNGKEKKEMLMTVGVDFDEYPRPFRHGTFVQRRTSERCLTTAELLVIPEKHRPTEGALVTRSSIEPIDMPSFIDVANRVEVIFDGAAPLLKTV